MDIAYNNEAAKVLETLSKGAFLSTSVDEKNNVMTIGWGSIGYIWGKPVFMVMVRPSRYSLELIETNGEFAISIPDEGELREALALCGSKSGRDVDKAAAAGLKYSPAKTISVPIVDGCKLYYECKVLYKQAMDLQTAGNAIINWYPNPDDKHILYFGEITACYHK